jgi:nicotinate-nucleotide adenylyltransferase
MKPSPENGERWGILGGTFDPVHYGHLTLAEEICIHKGLNGVLLVPAVRHPLKRNHCHASYANRVEMLKRAVEDHPRLVVSEIEAEMNLSGYTLDTVRALKRLYPRTEFYFIMGADNLKELDKWHLPEQIFKEVKLLVGSRPGFDGSRFPEYLSGCVEVVATSLVDVSSTEVRRQIREGTSAEQLDTLVPPKVRQYILQKKLYQ